MSSFEWSPAQGNGFEGWVPQAQGPSLPPQFYQYRSHPPSENSWRSPRPTPGEIPAPYEQLARELRDQRESLERQQHRMEEQQRLLERQQQQQQQQHQQLLEHLGRLQATRPIRPTATLSATDHSHEARLSKENLKQIPHFHRQLSLEGLVE